MPAPTRAPSVEEELGRLRPKLGRLKTLLLPMAVFSTKAAHDQLCDAPELTLGNLASLTASQVPLTSVAAAPLLTVVLVQILCRRMGPFLQAHPPHHDP